MYKGMPKLKKRSNKVFVQLFRSPASLLASILYFLWFFGVKSSSAWNSCPPRVGWDVEGFCRKFVATKGINAAEKREGNNPPTIQNAINYRN